MSSLPVDIAKTTSPTTHVSPSYHITPNTEDPYVQMSQPQPDIELTQKSSSSSPTHSPPRQKLRRATESYSDEDLIGGQPTFEFGQSSHQEMT